MEIKYFSMFSGIGGFELGLLNSNTDNTYKCVGYSEINKPVIKTYEEHFNHDNFGDATTINADTLPRFDLLVAGFPCQAFSVAGRRLGFDDTRGTLFFDIARILESVKPQNFILENVKGLISHNRGTTFRTIIETLIELGYCVEWQVLNSADFDTPQNRERVFIVGHFGGIPKQPVFPIIRPSNPNTTLGKSTETAIARTLTAGGNSGGNHSGMTVLRTANGDRKLSTVEWERIQGFPDNWTIGAMGERKRQVGNSVPPAVVSVIAENLYT